MAIDTGRAPEDLQARVAQLESRVETLTEAVRALADGLESPPGESTRDDRAAYGARLAHELLLLPGAPASR